MSVTAPPQKRRVSIVGGDQLQDGSVTFDKIESDLLERIESTTLSAKINHLTFNDEDLGEIYLHGLVDGADADVSGYVFYGGIKHVIPKGPVTTQLDQEGYLVYSTAQDFASRGMTLVPDQYVVGAFVVDGYWYYDDNTLAPKPFTPNPNTDIVIGYYRTDGSDNVEEAYIFKDPLPVNEVVVTSRKIMANAIISQHITAGEIITAHMMANSIEGNRILTDSLAAEKITTSVLNADLTLSGSIKTADSGARVEMDNLGLRSYNSGGAQTANIDASDGSVTIVGGIQSGGEIEGATITGGTIRTNTSPTTDGIILDDANGLRAYEAGVLNAQIDRLGAAAFNKAIIAGPADDVSLSIGSGSSVFRVDTSGVYVGSSSFSSAPFRVAYDGSAILTKATLTGANLAANEKIINTASFSVDKEGDVVASSITVSDGTISGGTIDIGDDAFHVDSSGQLWMGAALYAAAPFRISNSGALDIGGVDNTSFHIDNIGNVWAGAGSFASAPFRVSNTGALTAENVTITGSDGNIINTTNFVVSGSGAITADSGVFNSGTINGDFSVVGNLNVNGGSINLASGDLNVDGTGNINVSNGEVVVSADGSMRSANYDAEADTGWLLGPTGLDLNGLSLGAGSLQIGISNTNLVRNGSFESGTTTATNWTPFATGSASANFTVTDSDPLYQNKSQRIVVASSGGNVGVYQDVAVNEPVDVGETITFSYWAKQTDGIARSARVWFHAYGSGTTVLRNSHSETLTLDSWVRVVDQYTVQSPTSNGFRVHVLFGPDLATGDTFFVDGAQLQRSDFVTDFQPTPLEIPDNYINSSHISTLSADKLTSGTISAHTIQVGASGHIQSFDFVENNSGYQLRSDGATFQNGAITMVGAGGAILMDSTQFRATYGGQETLVVDSTGLKLAGSIEVTPSAIESSNFATTTGWQINSAGEAIFNKLTARNTLYIGKNQISPDGQGNFSDYLSSSNFQAGVSGWVIRGNGDVEFRNGKFRGQVNATSGTFSGSLQAATGTFSGDLAFADGTFTGTLSGVDGNFTGTLTGNTISGASISGGTIDIGGNDSTSFHVDSGGNMWSGASTFWGSPFRVSSGGLMLAMGASIITSTDGSTGIIIGTNGGTKDSIDLKSAHSSEYHPARMQVNSSSGLVQIRAGSSSSNHSYDTIFLHPQWSDEPLRINSGTGNKWTEMHTTLLSITGSRAILGGEIGLWANAGELKIMSGWSTTSYQPIRASAHLTGSSIDFKEDVRIAEFSALESIRKAKPRKYRYKASVEEKEMAHLLTLMSPSGEQVKPEIRPEKLGLIVEELPEEVVWNNDAISLDEMTAFLWKAVQELDARIEELDKKSEEE